MTERPFAITLDVGSSLANRTGSWRDERPLYVHRLPPCNDACPAGENVQRWLYHAEAGDYETAWRTLVADNPLPAVMGRVCYHPCETSCNRGQLDEAVGINAVERFLGDEAIRRGWKLEVTAPPSGKRVLVVGAGPSGLSAAHQLALAGHDVTIREAGPAAGGMMRFGIPRYRLPRDVLDAEIQRILDLGVTARMATRIGTDITLEQLRADFDAVFLGLGAQSGRPLPVEGADAPNCVTATVFLKAFNDGRMLHVGKRVVVVGGGDTSIDVATVARRLGHIDQVHESDRPENAIAGFAAHDAALLSRRQGAEVTLTSVFAIDKMQASKHEVEHALAEGIAMRGGYAPVAVVRGADGRATALRVARCEAKLVGGRLDLKVLPGTEEDIPADLIVSAIGQAVDFTGLDALNNGKGGINADKNYQVQGAPGMFVGGDVVRPHLLTTAIGHGAIAADGIDRFLAGEALDKRPKIDVHSFDLTRKMVEKGLKITRIDAPTWGTDASTGAIHNYDNRSDRYVIPHTELFLGHFNYTPRLRREIVNLTAAEALNNFEERMKPLLEAQAQAEAKRCMSCGQCFECDNCVVYCPQTAVFKVPKAKATTGRYVDTDYTKCIGCHICKDVCPTGYIQMGLGE